MIKKLKTWSQIYHVIVVLGKSLNALESVPSYKLGNATHLSELLANEGKEEL